MRLLGRLNQSPFCPEYFPGDLLANFERAFVPWSLRGENQNQPPMEIEQRSR
jgi:hypothetical protein